MFQSKYVAIALAAVLLSGCDLFQAPPAKKVELPEPESVGAQTMKKYCSDCHAPPAPQTHNHEEWPNVVYRMQEHRRMHGYNMMNADEEAALVTYVQAYAKK